MDLEGPRPLEVYPLAPHTPDPKKAYLWAVATSVQCSGGSLQSVGHAGAEWGGGRCPGTPWEGPHREGRVER